MKHAKVIFVLLLVLPMIGYFMQSCEKETTELENTEVQKKKVIRSDYDTREEYLEARNKEIEASGVEYTVEYATLEELNADMIKYGMEPFTEEDVIRFRKRSCPLIPCATWENHGDWSGDWNFSTYDLGLANGYVCTYPGSGGCPYLGGQIDDIHNLYDQGLVSGKALDFAQLSDFICEGGTDVLDYDDILIGRDYILAIFSCL